MEMTILEALPGRTVLEIGEPLFSEQVRSVNAAKDLVGGIKAMFGANLREYGEDIQKTRAAALADLRAQGEAWGADALLGLRVDCRPFVNDGTVFFAMSAYATPVRWLEA